MGLHVTNGCWEGSYSAFAVWRNALATAAGYGVITQHRGGRVNGYGIDIPCIPWNQLGNIRTLRGKWDYIPCDSRGNKDYLLILLCHYDCDGVIDHQHCKPLADRLEGLLDKLEEFGDGGGHIGSFAEKTRKFISGLRDAHENNETVEFV